MQGKYGALLLIVSVLFGFSAHGQVSPPQSQSIVPTPSEFEVATIKPSTIEPGPRGGFVSLTRVNGQRSTKR